jgi:hypothetical protein
MTATTPPSMGKFQDHHLAREFRLSVFPWHAHPFLDFNKECAVNFQTFEDTEPPYVVVFSFKCDKNQLYQLLDRYMEAGYPIALTNFNLQDVVEKPA